MSDVNVIPEPQIMLRKGRDPKISAAKYIVNKVNSPMNPRRMRTNISNSGDMFIRLA